MYLRTLFFGFVLALSLFTKGIAMQPTINIVTLGVKDISQSRKFYETLGFKASSMSNEHFVAFKTQGVTLCLFQEDQLAHDATVDPKRQGFRGVTLAHNVATKEEVQKVLDHAAKAGAKILKPAQDVFWGGHSGYFADPDGHLWEVAWNPHFPLQNGMLEIPD